MQFRSKVLRNILNYGNYKKIRSEFANYIIYLKSRFLIKIYILCLIHFKEIKIKTFMFFSFLTEEL